MNLQEKLKIDKETVPRAMVFFEDGNFYGAYERSVFLAKKFLPPLKINCRYYKSVEQTVASVGFPISSLAKFANNKAIEQRDGLLLIPTPEGTDIDEEEYNA